MNRDISIILNKLLDGIVPPVIRDSRWFAVPLLRIARGAQYAKAVVDFKKRVNDLMQKEIADLHDQLIKRISGTAKRKTDLNRKCRDRLLAEIVDTTVLEIGCGEGWLAGRLAEKNRVSAVDIAISEELRARYPAVTFRQEDCKVLSFADNEFDVVVTSHTLEHITNIPAAIEQARRVCRERLIVVVPCQRPYLYTPDLHIHFFPYPHSLVNTLCPSPGT